MANEVRLDDGFVLEIDPECIDDIELLELLAQMNGSRIERVAALPQFMVKVLGSDQKDRLYEHIRNDKGRVPVSVLEIILPKIIEGMDSKKN